MAHRIAPQAEIEIDDIWCYIAKQSGDFDIADRFIDSLADRFLLLARHSHVGRSRAQDLRPGLRSFALGEYVIIYRIENEDALILRVLRGSRNIEALFQH